jgi:beta-mannosidase
VPASQTLILDGDWQLAQCHPASGGAPQTKGLDWLPAAVPGAVHYDLVRAKKLENPLSSRQAAASADWVSHSDWLYRRAFVLIEALAPVTRAVLRFDSIDTFADIWLNGVHIGSSGNAFRPCHLDVDPALLRQGENTLLVHVKGHDRMLADVIPDAGRIAVGSHSTAHRDRSLIRRYQRSYNTSLLNLGENVIGIGIPGGVRLCLYPEVYLRELCLVTDAVIDGVGLVCVVAEVEGDTDGLGVEVAVYEEGVDAPVAATTAPVVGARLEVRLEVPEARLWWPHGHGEPHLYRLTARLLHQGSEVHAIQRRVGIKTVELEQTLPNGRPTFQLRVNECEVYVRGGNLIPIDAIGGIATPDAYERMLQLTLNANMNLIRLWGGGMPEDEGFLDRCDELGIMIWQDFLYHSCTYPDYDAGFMAEAEAEAVDLIRKMRPHACLAILCGGNEQQQGWDEWNWKEDVDRFYGERLINDLLPQVCAAYAPEIPYIPNSPHGGIGGQSPVVGDTHTWGNYYNATKDPLFVTETCWIYDSYSRPETLREAMGLEVDALAYHGWHRRWRELTGLGLFTKFPFTHYYDIASLRGYLRALEIEQLEADHQALAFLRLRSPSCNGIVYWPLNKGGPLFGFGCIDYGGRPLMSYYAVQRLFADVALHLYRDAADVRVVGANATDEPVAGVLRLWHLNAAGRSRGYWELPTTIAPGNSLRLFDIDGFYDEVIDRTREWVYAEFLVQGCALTSAQLLFCPLAELQLEPGEMRVAVEQLGPGRWRLDLEMSAPTPLVEIEADRRVMYSDDYFALIPGIGKRVIVTSLEAEPPAEIRLAITPFGGAAGTTITLPLGHTCVAAL